MNCYRNMKFIAGWAGATISTNTDTDSPLVIDCQGFADVCFAVYSGTVTDGNYELKVIQGDQSNLSDKAVVTAVESVNFTTAAADDNAVKKVFAPVSKRYAALRITSTGATTGGVFKGAIACLGTPVSAPVA